MFAFESPFARFLWVALCHSLWSVPLIGLISTIRLDSLSPAKGDRRMRLATLACVFVPFTIALASPVFESFAPRPNSIHFESSVVSTIGIATVPDRLPRPNPQARKTVHSPGPAIASAIGSLFDALTAWAIPAWIAGMTLLSLRLIAGTWILRARNRDVPAPPKMRSMADDLAFRMRIRIPPAIRVSNSANQPIVLGLIRPSVIVPVRWAIDADDDTLQAVLAHELAHIRRGDLLHVLIERIAGIVWFFHPAMHRSNRQAALWRELAADRLATDVTGDPLALARALESAATWAAMIRNGWNRTGSALANAAIGSESDLRVRIETILRTKGSRKMKFGTRAKSTLIASIFMCLGYGLVMSSNTFRPPAGLRYEYLGIDEVRIESSGKYDDEADQIAHDLYFVTLESGTLDEVLQKSGKRLTSKSGTTCWQIPAKDVTAFIEPIRHGLEHGTITIWPKVTSFSRQRIEYAIGIETPIVTGWTKAESHLSEKGNSVRIAPQITNFETGIKFDITSELKGDSTSIELTGNYAGLKIRTSERTNPEPGGGKSSVHGFHSLSDIVQSGFEVKADIPDHEMLVFELDETFEALPDRTSKSKHPGGTLFTTGEFRSMQRYMVVRPIRIDAKSLQ